MVVLSRNVFFFFVWQLQCSNFKKFEHKQQKYHTQSRYRFYFGKQIESNRKKLKSRLNAITEKILREICIINWIMVEFTIRMADYLESIKLLSQPYYRHFMQCSMLFVAFTFFLVHLSYQQYMYYILHIHKTYAHTLKMRTH